MDSAAREALARSAIANSPADLTEVLITESDNALTRFTHETIHQNVAARETLVQVRAIVDGRTGIAAGSALDDASIATLRDRAIALARLAPKAPIPIQLPAPAPIAPVAGAYVAATADATPDLRAQAAETIVDHARRADAWAAGFVRTGRGGVTVANSAGVRASFDATDAAINTKFTRADSTGYAEALSRDTHAVDAEVIGARAADVATRSAAPQSVPLGEWTVILEPAAFGELLSYLTDHFSVQNVDEGTSFISDGLDKRYLGENVTIRDDWSHPLAPGMPFDFEGAPKERLALVENGVVRNVVSDSFWATKLNMRNTGHALPAPNTSGPEPTNIVVDPGSKTREELIASTKRGLLITRFWYIRTVDQRTAIVTGMTRDGVFAIEDGKVKGGVRNMRFNQSLLEAMRRCEFADNLTRTGGYSYGVVVPSVKIEGFRFTSGTSF